ncbi:MAG: hypothetical protein AB8G22_27650, partial [Saprospiraceae bacterium]
MLRKILPLLFTVCTFSVLNAQKLDHVLGEVMVRMQADADIETLVSKHQLFAGELTQLVIKEEVSKHMDIWLLKFDFTKVDEFAFAEQLYRSPLVETIQQNHILALRSTTPNDPQFNQQWQYINTGQGGGEVGADIDMELAWDIST